MNMSRFLGESLRSHFSPRTKVSIVCGDHFGDGSQFGSKAVGVTFNQDKMPKTSYPHAAIFSDIRVTQKSSKVNEKHSFTFTFLVV